jgi:hypothetical protein
MISSTLLDLFILLIISVGPWLTPWLEDAIMNFESSILPENPVVQIEEVSKVYYTLLMMCSFCWYLKTTDMR